MENMHADARLQRVSPTKYNELKLRCLSEKPVKTFLVLLLYNTHFSRKSVYPDGFSFSRLVFVSV